VLASAHNERPCARIIATADEHRILRNQSRNSIELSRSKRSTSVVCRPREMQQVKFRIGLSKRFFACARSAGRKRTREQSLLWLVARLRAVWPNGCIARRHSTVVVRLRCIAARTSKRSENVRFSTSRRLPSLPKLYTLRGVSAGSTTDVIRSFGFINDVVRAARGKRGLVCRDEHTYRTITTWLLFNQRG